MKSGSRQSEAANWTSSFRCTLRPKRKARSRCCLCRSLISFHKHRRLSCRAEGGSCCDVRPPTFEDREMQRRARNNESTSSGNVIVREDRMSGRWRWKAFGAAAIGPSEVTPGICRKSSRKFTSIHFHVIASQVHSPLFELDACQSTLSWLPYRLEAGSPSTTRRW